MSAPRDADTILAAWLEEGPTELPEPTRRAIAVATRTTRQSRRAIGVPWRINPMSPFPRLAIAAVSIAVVAGGALFLLSPDNPGIGGPSPSAIPSISAPSSGPPSPAPQGTVPVDWATHTSTRFGYAIDYPADWVVTPATSDWVGGGLHPEGTNLDRFGVTPSSPAWVLVSSIPITADQSSADRIAQLDEINAPICQLSNRRDITIDGVGARQEDFFCYGKDYGIEVVAANESRHFQIDLFSSTPIGATDREIFDRFLASFRFAAPAVAWQSFTSDRFGYTVELPGEWEITTPTDDLPDELYPGSETDYGDRWDPPPMRTPWFIIAVRDPAPQEPIDEWVARYTTDMDAACSAIEPVAVEVSGESGVLRAGPCLLPGVDIVDVLVVHSARAYTITIAGVSLDAAINRATFDQILASFRFTD